MHPKSFSEHAERIARRGRSFVGVFPCEGDDGHAFSYTIGNHLRGLPELLIVGDCRALAVC